MDLERLEGLRVALRLGEQAVARQVTEAQEQERLGQTLLRVAVTLVAAESADLGLFTTTAEAGHRAILLFGLGVIMLLFAVIRLVTLSAGTSKVVVGPDPRALSAASEESELTESRLLRSVLRNIPMYFQKNEQRLRMFARGNRQGALLMVVSAAATAGGFVYMAGGPILG